MLPYTLYTPEDFRVSPWKNGQGSTTELYAAYPPGEADFLWRISMAGVTRDGNFSDFSGYDRILLLLEGAGMTLFFESHGICQLEKPLDLARFSGDWKTRAVLKEGAIRDFNVMTRRDGCQAKVRTFSEESFSREQEYPLDFRGDHLLLYLPKNPGTLHASSRESLTLPPGHLLHFQGSQKERWTLRCRGGIEVLITERAGETSSPREKSPQGT